jgi:hypothetical protein
MFGRDQLGEVGSSHRYLRTTNGATEILVYLDDVRRIHFWRWIGNHIEIPRKTAMMMSNAPIRVVGGEQWVVSWLSTHHPYLTSVVLSMPAKPLDA